VIKREQKSNQDVGMHKIQNIYVISSKLLI